MIMNYFEPNNIKQSKLSIFITELCMYLKYIYYKYVCRSNIKVIYPNISYSYGLVRHSNWGDDLNMFFIPLISKDIILPGAFLVECWGYPLPWLRNYTKYKCIGSVFDTIYEDNTIVWGAGMIEKNKYPHMCPLKILAVRGPLTYKQLVSKGYDCPEVYGDPALLLPYYYKPRSHFKKYKIGIIPHYTDLHKEEVLLLSKNKDVLLINVFKYKNWKCVIDQICSCEFIASSSLHGLIVSEAYNIPNLWVEFVSPIVGDISKRFKFHDFFLSQGLDRDFPYVVTKETTKESLLSECIKYIKAPGLSLKPLADACPFQLKRPLKPIK